MSSSRSGKRPRMHAGSPDRKTLEDFFALNTDNPLQGAFATKKVVHPFLNAAPVPKAMWSKVWGKIAATPRMGKSVAYIHIPFCENHCLFCGFYQNPWRTHACTSYTDALIEEMRRDKDQPYQHNGPIHAVYFGGGTPSALAAEDLRRLLETTRKTLPLAPDCEITIEGRVHNFTPDKIRACIEGGANRFSIGIQSFNDKLRHGQGRKADRAQTISFLEYLVSTDQAAVIIDLMYGFPDQSMEIWEDDVRTAISLGLDGIDLYALKLIPSSPLFTTIEKGKTGPAASTAELGRFYERGSQLMADERWDAISTTHWQRTTRERNLYNLLVKKGANCLAFGSGAGGFLGNYSFRMDHVLDTYSNRVKAGEKPLAFLMAQPDDNRLLNTIKGQMETGRLNLNWLADEFSAAAYFDYSQTIAPLLEQWQKSGLLTIDEGWLELTLAGRFWQVTLTQYLLEWISQNIPRSIAA